MTDIASVEPEAWAGAVAAAVESGFGYLDHLTAVDRIDFLEVIVLLRDPSTGAEKGLSTRVPASHPVLDSLTGIVSGADWHEREAAEMLGLSFSGHPGLVPLLTHPEHAQGRPPLLLKTTALPERIETAWPGADGGRRTRVPGIGENWERPS